MTNLSWDKRPLHSLVYSIIKRKKDLSYEDLVKAVKREVGEISENELKNALIKLELWGKINVISLNESRLRITLLS